MMVVDSKEDDERDQSADEAIGTYLNPAKPESFFLFAGAGSGKTRSLVESIRNFRDAHGESLRSRGQKFAVITFTNAARDEVIERLGFDPLIAVSTIHSFCWELIKGFNKDIRVWVRTNLESDIAELEEAQRKGRAGTKAEIERRVSIDAKRKRLGYIETVHTFTYSPVGDNRSRDSLNHAEVIAITASFLESKSALQKILVSRHPFVMIDECQDTNKYLMDALINVQIAFPQKFCIGLFGDTMQRIYSDGKQDIPDGLPKSWKTPAKQMNHRSAARIVELTNAIRSAADGQSQVGRRDKGGGIVRLFLLPNTEVDKFSVESRVALRMQEITEDTGWSSERSDYKTLILEHHMAAARLRFSNLFGSLSSAPSLRTGLLDGSLNGLKFLMEEVAPLLDYMSQDDRYLLTAHLRVHSPLLTPKMLKEAGTDQLALIHKARDAISAMRSALAANRDITVITILELLAQTNLLQVPDVFLPFVEAQRSAPDGSLDDDPANERSEVGKAWASAVNSEFSEIMRYRDYISGLSRYGTHQGVKGLEFPRVMVIIDDDEARGFMFSYDKLLGAKGKSKADTENEKAGKETSADRTRRLFYVTCSRAKQSLAVVHHTAEPRLVAENAIAQRLFNANEVELLN